MRRHFLYAEQAHETSVGDAAAKPSVLALWLARRQQFCHHHDGIARLLTLFWTLAKPTRALALAKSDYVNFFQRVAKALVQSVGSDHASPVASRDWLYDCAGSYCAPETDGDALTMSLEQFQEAVCQCADLVLPVESDASMFASFFQELRDAIAVPSIVHHPDHEPSVHVSADAPEAAAAASTFTSTYALRPLRDVAKIRGAFLQQMPPNAEHLALIRGLTSPDVDRLSLKQLLLSYNPRKFSSLFSTPTAAPATEETTASQFECELVEEPPLQSLAAASPLAPSALLGRESDDAFDAEDAAIRALESFSALRLAVVGPPGVGKTRVAESLARRLELQYVSLATAIEAAIVDKQARDAAREARRCWRAEQQEAALEAAMAESVGGDGDQAELRMDALALEADDSAPMDVEVDLLFGDADLATLQRGDALPTARALPLLVALVRKTLLRGVGVVVDDVFPAEVEDSLSIDYVVSLEMAREDARLHSAGFQLAPTSRRVYSPRELAMLSEIDALLREHGFADTTLFQEPASPRGVAAGEDSDETVRRRRAKVADAMAAAAAVAAKAKPTDSDDSGDDGNTDQAAPADEDSAEILDDGCDAEPLVETPSQRNEIEPLDEPTVPLRALTTDAFSARFRDFEIRAATLVSSERTFVIPVIGGQALRDIVEQCVVAITNNALGVSRSARSHAALRVVLPGDVSTSESSRADRLRWLLYGDWTEWLSSAAPPSAFTPGPSDPHQPRTLSRWRDCCLVSSAASLPILGDPQFAVWYNGRVYLFASALAREAFCATPLQFVRRRPPTLPAPRKIWVFTSGPLDAATCQALASLVDGDHVSATDVLSTCHSAEQIMALTEGKSVAPGAVASLVADAVVDLSAWVLTDLVPTKDALAVLHERNCLPNVIVTLTEDEADIARVTKTPLESKRHDQWMAQHQPDAVAVLTELLAEAQLTIPVRHSRLFFDAKESQAALHRVLCPLAPRVDSAEDGTRNDPATAEEEQLRVFGPATAPSDRPDETLDEDDGQEEEEIHEKNVALLGYDLRQQAWLRNRKRMGETAQFCAVTWATKCVLVPGLPQFVGSFQQKLYSFVGADELRAFERNPVAYLSSKARATQRLVPVLWILGARGSDVSSLAQSVAQSAKSVRIGVVDDASVAARVQRRLRAQLLRSEDTHVPLTAVYVDELELELHRLASSGRWDVVIATNISTAGVAMPLPLGDEESSEPAEVLGASPLPTPDLLALCFQRDLFPHLVLSLVASEELVLHRQLAKWREAQPPSRPSRRKTDGGSDDLEGDGDQDPVGLAELEATETARLQEQFQADQEAMALAVDSICSRGLVVERAISVAQTQRAVVKAVDEVIGTFLGRKESLFEYCERISISKAQRLLRSGEVVMGMHGLRCPVTGESPPSSSSSSSSSSPALIYRGRLYFPQSLTAMTQCELAPAATMVDATTQPPACPVSCCILGAPRVGKTRLARQLSKRFGLTYVSPQSAVDWVLQCLGPQSTFWSKLKSARDKDSRLLGDPDLVHGAIYRRLCSSECQRNGWVLDGYMLTPTEVARCLDATNQPIHPGVGFCLEGSLRHVWQSTRHNLALGTDAAESQRGEQLAEAFGAWQTHRLDWLRAWTSTFGSFHVRQIDAETNSVWQVHAHASDALEQHMAATRRYAQDIAMRRPARLYGVLRAQRALREHIHAEYQTFCPVELAAGRYHASLPQNRELCVECLGGNRKPVVLWFANEQNLRAFCASPDPFLSVEATSRASELIAKSPVDASLLSLLSVPDCEFPEMKGYCPVTFQQGTGDKDWQAIVKGSVFYRVSYENKVFVCGSEQKRRAFILQPTQYSTQLLPIKLPPQLSTPLAFKNCPGRLEQELSGVLNETLLLLGTARPKFLSVNMTSSACFYMALLLKTRATKALPDHIRARYVDQLAAFERDCRIGEQLKRLLAPCSTTSCGPGIKGARAVREMATSSSPSETDRALPGQLVVAEAPSIDLVRERFDELVHASSTKHTMSNQKAAAPRQNNHFLEYAKSLLEANAVASSSRA